MRLLYYNSKYFFSECIIYLVVKGKRIFSQLSYFKKMRSYSVYLSFKFDFYFYLEKVITIEIKPILILLFFVIVCEWVFLSVHLIEVPLSRTFKYWLSSVLSVSAFFSGLVSLFGTAYN